jgi:predicted RNase H-like nuclease (RuvC/YqgF family)
MKKTILLLLLTTYSYGQVVLSNDTANDVRNKLIECQYTEGELEIIKKLLENSMLDKELQVRIISSLESENKHLRNGIQNYRDIMDMMYQQKDELRDIIRKEERKKRANRWFYLTTGLAAGFFISTL